MKRFLLIGLIVFASPLAGQDGGPDAIDVKNGDGRIQPNDFKVEYHLERVRAHHGEGVTVRLSIFTRVPLRALAFAIDFDESRIVVDKVGPSEPARVLPAEIRSRIEWDSADREPGNQLGEGWIFASFESAAPDMDLGLPIGHVVPILDISCTVRDTATSGFSPITFRTLDVESPDIGRETHDNHYEEIAEIDEPVAAAVGEENLNGGGIEIVGEVGFFTRGDANFDEERDINDPVYTLRYLFQKGPMACSDAADANDDGYVDVSDPVFTLLRLYRIGGPFPDPDEWGPDLTDDDLICEIYSSGSAGN